MITGVAPECELAARVRQGHVSSVARLITALENRRAEGRAALGELYGAGGRAHVIGVTGTPGSGKSTLVATLARALRRREATVAIVAVDPSSSLTGGAILGDRIRMGEHTLDPGIFVRSMSTRGTLGGISRATMDAVCVLDAAGYDYVIVETVGVGQAEVAIVRAAHTTVVVSVPGLGDDVQAMKAGLLEVADLHVVNKADRPDADKTAAELLMMLALSSPASADNWAVPVISTSSVDGTGIDELADTLTRHLQWLHDSGELARRERESVVSRIRTIAMDLVVEELDDPARGRGFDDLVAAVAARRTDPHAAARQLIAAAAAAAAQSDHTRKGS